MNLTLECPHALTHCFHNSISSKRNWNSNFKSLPNKEVNSTAFEWPQIRFLFSKRTSGKIPDKFFFLNTLVLVVTVSSGNRIIESNNKELKGFRSLTISWRSQRLRWSYQPAGSYGLNDQWMKLIYCVSTLNTRPIESERPTRIRCAAPKTRIVRNAIIITIRGRSVRVFALQFNIERRRREANTKT